jgi:hypothetical protein
MTRMFAMKTYLCLGKSEPLNRLCRAAVGAAPPGGGKLREANDRGGK